MKSTIVMKSTDAVTALLEKADLISIAGQVYLISPVFPNQIDALAAFNAENEDAEDAGEAEPPELILEIVK